jgi:hypothetical protein
MVSSNRTLFYMARPQDIMSVATVTVGVTEVLVQLVGNRTALPSIGRKARA